MCGTGAKLYTNCALVVAGETSCAYRWFPACVPADPLVRQNTTFPLRPSLIKEEGRGPTVRRTTHSRGGRKQFLSGSSTPKQGNYLGRLLSSSPDHRMNAVLHYTVGLGSHFFFRRTVLRVLWRCGNNLRRRIYLDIILAKACQNCSAGSELSPVPPTACACVWFVYGRPRIL